MALLDVLQARTERRARTAQVDCGELGLLSVEALPPAELARLQHDRAVLYAACRELQSAGETLRRAGKLFTPDEITAYLSDEEAASGAAVVRDISGVSASRDAPGAGTDTVSGAEDGSASRTENGEIRLDTVQAENHVDSESRHIRKSGSPRVRPDTVQAEGKIPTSIRPDFPEIRLPSVQEEPETPISDSGAEKLQTVHGQDSREFSSRGAGSRKTDKKSQGIVDLPGERTPNLGQNPVRPEGSGLSAAHETTSDFREKLHEITSESAGFGAEVPHETKSELRETLHETKSEIHPAMWEGLHETTSEQAAPGAGALHETESDFAAVAPMETHGTMGKVRESVHETKSESGETGPGAMHEIRSEVREILHEMESEFTDRVAKALLDGLRRAAAVR